MLVAPRSTAVRYAADTSGTCSATSFAASPCLVAKRTISLSERSPLVSTSLISPCSSVRGAIADTGLGARVGDTVEPERVLVPEAACLAFPTQSST